MNSFRPFPFLLFLLCGATCLLNFSAKKETLVKDRIVTGEASTFWSVDRHGGVRVWQIGADTTVTGGETVDSLTDEERSDCSGLAWCSLLGKKPALHLFINDVGNDNGFMSLLPVSETPQGFIPKTNNMVNIGGYGTYLYVQYYTSDGELQALLRWRPSRVDTISHLASDEVFGVADIAVDTLGRAWFLTGDPHDYDETDDIRLCCVSPQGKELCSLPVSGISQNHAYGFMLNNGRFYVAFGESNNLHPNELVPLVYNGGEMIAGAPLPFELDGHDLASKNPGCPNIPMKRIIDSSNQKN